MPETTTPQLTKSDVDAIEARANAASPPPWSSPANHQPWPDNASELSAIVCGDGGYINHRNWKQVCHNMNFLSQARTDIPALIRDWRALRADLDEVRQLKEVAKLNVADLQSENAALREQLAQETQRRIDAEKAAEKWYHERS